MSYYQALGLVREPFSNSPDPDLLYRSPSHLECLQHMEIAVRLRRGLNVVLGEVGTGKTTLGRELARLLATDPDIEVHFIDDPYHASPVEFLAALTRLFGLDPAPFGGDAGALREAVKEALSARGQDGKHLVALIVDEGQKITPACLELLRELLNFETNTHKLLQIVIFAQNEFEDVLAGRPNLEDRVNFRYHLLPLNRKQTRRMVETRLALCAAEGQAPALFTAAALRRIHRLTGGYPRKIVRLCHLAMLLGVGFGRHRIDWRLVGRAAREQRKKTTVWLGRGALVAGCALAGLVAIGLWRGGPLPQVRQAAHVLRQAVTVFTSVPGPAVQGRATDTRTLPPVAIPVAAPAGDGETTPGPAIRRPAVRAPITPPEAESVAPRQKTRQDLGAAMDLAAAALPPDASEQVIVVAPEDGLSVPAVTAVAALAPASPADASVQKAGSDAQGAALAQIGTTVVRPGWIVSKLAATLYGSGNRQVLARLAAANPGKNFDRMQAGDTLVYPPIEAPAPPTGAYLVKVVGVDNLEQGFAFVIRWKRRHELALFCTRQPGSGLRYDVVLPELYADQAAAQAALASLPREMAAKAALVSTFPAGTTYFTDLGEGRRLATGVTRAMAEAGGRRQQVAESLPSPLPGRP